MGNVYVFDITSICFHGKGNSENLRSIKNTGNNLTMKQMFDISEKLIVGQSDEFFGVSQMTWEISPWKQLSLVNGEEFVSLSPANVYVFSDSVLCLGKMNENPQSNTHWEDKLTWFKKFTTIQNFGRNWWWANGIRVEYFPGFTTLQLCDKVLEFISKMCEKPQEFTGRIIFMSMFNCISWGSKDNRQPRFYLCEKIFTRKMVIPRTWIRKEVVFYSWLQTTRRMGQSRRTDDDKIFRKLKSRGGGKLSIHFCADERTIENVFRTIISVNQLSIHGAVSDLWRIQSLPCKNGGDLLWQDNLTHCLCQLWWNDWILETERWSSEQIWALSTLVWWNVEEQNGRRRRQQENISILYWFVRTRNSLSPSSSIRLQSYWSYSTGQCDYSEQLLLVHLSFRMCNEFTLHHEFRNDTRRTKFEQKTDGILHVCGSCEQRTQRSEHNWPGVTASCMVPSEKVEETSKHGVLGRHQTCSKEAI